MTGIRLVVVEAWHPDDRKPLILKEGDHVEVGHHDTEWTAYRWCTGEDGTSGWVPLDYLVIEYRVGAEPDFHTPVNLWRRQRMFPEPEGEHGFYAHLVFVGDGRSHAFAEQFDGHNRVTAVKSASQFAVARGYQVRTGSQKKAK